jgi:hypothetical protein
MIANVAPSFRTFYDTYHTLNYATKSRTIINHVEVGFSSVGDDEEVEKEKRHAERKIACRSDRSKTMHEKLEEWRKTKRRSVCAFEYMQGVMGTEEGVANQSINQSSTKRTNMNASDEQQNSRMAIRSHAQRNRMHHRMDIEHPGMA